MRRLTVRILDRLGWAVMGIPKLNNKHVERSARHGTYRLGASLYNRSWLK